MAVAVAGCQREVARRRRVAGGGQRQAVGSPAEEARPGFWADLPQSCCSLLLLCSCAAPSVEAGLLALLGVAYCSMVQGVQPPAQLICMHAPVEDRQGYPALSRCWLAAAVPL